ncbi:MAG: TolC family protein [Candidatus Hydrogenedentota bacterium]
MQPKYKPLFPTVLWLSIVLAMTGTRLHAQPAGVTEAAPATQEDRNLPSEPQGQRPAAPPPTAEEDTAGTEMTVPAQPVEATEQVELRYEDFFETADRSIQRQIDVDLIDLDQLRQALDVEFGQSQVRLSLDDCLMLALENNPDILVSQYEPLKADGDIMSAKGEFDPVARTDMNYTESSQAASQQIRVFGGISSIESYTTTSTTSMSQKLHTGTVWNLAFSLNREETTFGGFIEEWDGAITVSLTQPLLRGVGTRVNKVRISQARNAKDIAEEQMRLTVMQTTASVIKAYWDLVGAVENLKVRQESLRNAERLLTINETRREIGTAADTDVLQAKAGVATRQSELVMARNAVGTAGDQLKQILDLRDGEHLSRARIIPTSRPHIDEEDLVAQEELDTFLARHVELAIDNRPEVNMAALTVDNAELEKLSARNQMLPQFDAGVSYTQGGRQRSIDDVLTGIRAGQTDVLSFTITGSVPIGNRAARGQHLRARLGVREAEQRHANAEQQLMLGVHLAVRNMFTNQTLIESTRQAREFQEVSVTAEEKRLRLGVTTSYQVLLVQEDLTAAQTQEVQAIVDYQKARTDLRLAAGTLLEDLGIAFTPPEEERAVGYIDSVTPRLPSAGE